MLGERSKPGDGVLNSLIIVFFCLLRDRNVSISPDITRCLYKVKYRREGLSNQGLLCTHMPNISFYVLITNFGK